MDLEKDSSGNYITPLPTLDEDWLYPTDSPSPLHHGTSVPVSISITPSCSLDVAHTDNHSLKSGPLSPTKDSISLQPLDAASEGVDIPASE